MSDERKDVKVLLSLTSSMSEAIDDWRFENKIATKSEAMRQLLQSALSGQPGEPSPPPPPKEPEVPPDLEKYVGVPWAPADFIISKDGFPEMQLYSQVLQRAKTSVISFEQLLPMILDPRVLVGVTNLTGIRNRAIRTMEQIGWKTRRIRHGRNGKPDEIWFYAVE